mgnify:CR=1 FL=1|jgi:hypothetical protein
MLTNGKEGNAERFKKLLKFIFEKTEKYEDCKKIAFIITNKRTRRYACKIEKNDDGYEVLFNEKYERDEGDEEEDHWIKAKKNESFLVNTFNNFLFSGSDGKFKISEMLEKNDFKEAFLTLFLP